MGGRKHAKTALTNFTRKFHGRSCQMYCCQKFARTARNQRSRILHTSIEGFGPTGQSWGPFLIFWVLIFTVVRSRPRWSTETHDWKTSRCVFPWLEFKSDRIRISKILDKGESKLFATEHSNVLQSRTVVGVLRISCRAFSCNAWNDKTSLEGKIAELFQGDRNWASSQTYNRRLPGVRGGGCWQVEACEE